MHDAGHMIEWNYLTAILVVVLFGLWKLELIATLLNLKCMPSRPPQELEGLLDEDKLRRASDYQRVNARFDITQSTFSLSVLLAFWLVGGFEGIDNMAREFSSNELTVGLIFLSSLFVLQTLINLPFNAYETFVIEERFGFNRSKPATFIADRFKVILLAIVIGLPLAAAILWIFNNVAHAWLWAWAVVTVIQLLLAWLAPSLIMPLFNKFTPMPEGDLKQRIESLGKRCDFPLDEVFVMDGSKRSTKANAFFTGFGKRKKIALFDTLIDKSSPEELMGVLAHEIGHFKRGHIKQRLGAGIVQTAVIFFLLGLAIDPSSHFSRILFDAFGVTTISPHAGLVLFVILLEPVSKALAVMFNAWSRKHEFEADAYAVEMTGNGEPLAEALKKMSADHLSHPAPSKLRVVLDYSHPPLLERLRAIQASSPPDSP